MEDNFKSELSGTKILSPKEILKYMGILLLSMVIGAVLGGLSSLLFNTLFFVLFAIIGGGVLGILSICFFLKYRKGFTWTDLGFKTPKYNLLHLFWQIPLSIIGSLTFAGCAGKFLNIAPPEKASPVNHTLFNGGSLLVWVIVAAYFLSGTLLIPIIEEIVFRRLLTDLTSKRFGKVLSIIINSVVFALFHISPLVMLYVFPLGLALNILYRRYDSLWASFALHAVNNLLTLSLVLLALF